MYVLHSTLSWIRRRALPTLAPERDGWTWHNTITMITDQQRLGWLTRASQESEAKSRCAVPNAGKGWTLVTAQNGQGLEIVSIGQ